MAHRALKTRCSHPVLFSCLIFSAKLSRIGFNLANDAENSTSNILIPTIGEVRQGKDATACVLLWMGMTGGSPAVLPVARLPAVGAAFL